MPYRPGDLGARPLDTAGQPTGSAGPGPARSHEDGCEAGTKPSAPPRRRARARAALFPQNPGANPTGTVGALAYRTANALRDRYFNAPGELLT